MSRDAWIMACASWMPSAIGLGTSTSKPLPSASMLGAAWRLSGVFTMTASSSTASSSSVCVAKRLSLGMPYFPPSSSRACSKGSAIATTSMNDAYSLAKYRC